MTAIDTPAIEKLLGELEALHEKTTPGPWQHHGSHFYGPDTDRFLIGHVLSNDGRLVPDRNLIVAAVNAIPTLITTIRALTAKVTGSDLNGWQPIDTAPKDGAKFDAWVPDAFGGHRMCNLSFNWRNRLRQNGLLSDAELPRWPTHWMPLPQPPAIRSKGDA